jgi:hypothetical protein
MTNFYYLATESTTGRPARLINAHPLMLSVSQFYIVEWVDNGKEGTEIIYNERDFDWLCEIRVSTAKLGARNVCWPAHSSLTHIILRLVSTDMLISAVGIRSLNQYVTVRTVHT